MNKKDRLKKISKEVGEKSVKSLCFSIGVSYDTAGNWGKRNKIAPNGILAIRNKYPQISETYLKTGEGSILVEQEPSLPPEILELIEDYKTLSDDKKQEYSLKIKRDAIEEKLKGSES